MALPKTLGLVSRRGTYMRTIRSYRDLHYVTLLRAATKPSRHVYFEKIAQRTRSRPSDLQHRSNNRFIRLRRSIKHTSKTAKYTRISTPRGNKSLNVELLQKQLTQRYRMPDLISLRICGIVVSAYRATHGNYTQTTSRDDQQL